MRMLNYYDNPVSQAYNGGDQLNVRQLANAHAAHESNMREIEKTIHTLENSIIALSSKLGECYEFINWVQKHSPETTQAYKAHNAVLHTFDKAEQGESVAYAETAGPA